MTIVRFSAVGDISLGDHPLCAGFGTHSMFREKDPEEIFKHVADVLNASDLTFGNLECTLSEIGKRGGDYHSIQMRGQPSYLHALKHSGFAVLNLANNHSMQHGKPAFRDTVTMLGDRDISVCGLADENSHRAKLLIQVCDGVRIGFLGYSLRPRQYFTELPLYAEGIPSEMVEDVKSAAAVCDSVVVSAHWGDEFIDKPSPEEIAMARSLVDAGAALIIGHHPHVLRGIEQYRNGVIVYSLGNFVCDMLWDPILRESAVFRCKLSKGGATDPEIVPIWINDLSQPTPASPERAERIQARLRTLAEELASTNDSRNRGADAYDNAAKEAHARIRAKSHYYFLRNLHRYPSRLLRQNLANFVGNRLNELKEFIVGQRRSA